MSVKQVIVMRTDTDPPMRKGKMIAQGAHASIAFITRRLQRGTTLGTRSNVRGVELSKDEREWIEGSFAKVCVRVDSEQELMDIHDRAKEAGLEVHLITDSGKTEFKEPTRTCLAIGPHKAEKIDPITGHLKLL